MGCVFCLIGEGKIPAVKVFDSDKFFVAMDIFPEAPGHCLVVPKKHYLKPADIPKEEFGELMQLVVRVQEAVVSSGVGQGTLVQQNYLPFVPEGGLKVDHVHFHVIPRNPSDEIGERQSREASIRKKAESSQLEPIAGRIKNSL